MDFFQKEMISNHYYLQLPKAAARAGLQRVGAPHVHVVWENSGPEEFAIEVEKM